LKVGNHIAAFELFLGILQQTDKVVLGALSVGVTGYVDVERVAVQNGGPDAFQSVRQPVFEVNVNGQLVVLLMMMMISCGDITGSFHTNARRFRQFPHAVATLCACQLCCQKGHAQIMLNGAGNIKNATGVPDPTRHNSIWHGDG